MTTREHHLARLRARMDSVSDAVLAEQHSAKMAEMVALRARVRAARAALGESPTEVVNVSGPSYVRRLAGLVRHPSRVKPAIGRRTRVAEAVLAAVAETIEREGGPRPTARKTLGLLLRDGFRGVPPLYPVRDHTDHDVATPMAPIRPRWYSATEPEVSIVVLNWNRASVTLECLRSLWEHTAGHPYEIVLVDNGSSPSETAAFDELAGPCRVLRLELNRYFGEGNNIGVEAALAPYVVLMNNDVTVTPGWLEPLMQAIEESDDCGVAGPKFCYPNGLLQEAGGLLDENGNSVQVGKFQVPSAPEFNEGRAVDYVSAACCLLRTEDFERVHGFDMRYEPAYYEDADLCMKLGQLGLKTMYVPDSQVVHHESVTTADTSHGLGLTNISELNRLKFLDRWGGYLRTGRHAPAPMTLPLIACVPSSGGRTIGLYSPFELTPGGGEKYLLTLASEALRRGTTVHFVSPAPYSRVRLTALAAMFGLDLDGLCISTLSEAEEMPVFDEWVAMGNQVVPTAPALGKRNTLLCQFPFRAGLEQWRLRQRWLEDYERIVVYSAFTADAVRDRLAEAHIAPQPITVLTPPVDLTEAPIRPTKAGIVSTGRFFSGDHSKRQDLQIEAFRRLVAEGAGEGVTLHLVGSSATRPIHRQFLIDCMEAAKDLDVQFHVDAPLSELTEIYAASSLYWHSSGLGVDVTLEPERCEHFGIAPIEAMAHGTIPLVVNNGGPATTVRDGIDGFHYDSVDQLVALTRSLLSRPEEDLRPMRETARARAQQFSRAAFAKNVESLFDL